MELVSETLGLETTPALLFVFQRASALFTSTNSNFANGTSTDGTPSAYLNPTLKVAPEDVLTIAITSTDNVQTTSTTSTAVALSAR